ncbi:aspartate ammonia-lyase [Sinirhodobacter sp. WL0062]|uniref:Aspartate ammonia-lyase n=1 Tax=Rhodobacter flavimaris TaxID=2907145 RepID=A0ABS8YWW8_9RHOB|nr:aspartate ammonia-lyase [Sinirhodobacter sp. WL0062]MCE5974302.1 aspartate ammonia-lyase [Sinirhodobacter sp. WL0062]
MHHAMRIEEDNLGQIHLPSTCLWGIHTQRAIDNFPISGMKLNLFPEFIRALAWVKTAAARANRSLGVLSGEKARVIEEVCADIVAGRYHDAFRVDMIQGGAGTSTNMNANEVIANLGLMRMGHAPGEYDHLHPNDDVNRSQSTNDVYPTAMRLAIVSQCDDFRAAQLRLAEAFKERAEAFADIRKIGRTQLQDAVPMTLGQEFAGFAATILEDVEIIGRLSHLLLEVNLGGTAIGTRVNTPEGYAEAAVRELARVSGLEAKLATDLIEASSDTGAYVTFSGVLKRISVKLSKICNDLRLLSSGPRSGFMEIRLPAVQAGSSIMPGKVNPVIPEVVNQVAFQVIGNDLTVTMAAEAGQLQLNAFEPVIVLNVLQSMRILMHAMDTLAERCVKGIEANVSQCEGALENSLVLATMLVPHIGYSKAAKVAKIALAEGAQVVETAVKMGYGTAEEIEAMIR